MAARTPFLNLAQINRATEATTKLVGDWIDDINDAAFGNMRKIDTGFGQLSMDLTNLESTVQQLDTGLHNDLNAHNTSNTAHADIRNNIGDLSDRVDAISSLGKYLGAFDTFSGLPNNASEFDFVSVNDFATVRADENNNGVPARYVVSAIDGSGVITWTFDLLYSTDVSEKMSLVSGATNGNIATLNNNGQAVDSGLSPATMPVSTAQQAEIETRAPIHNPRFTGFTHAPQYIANPLRGATLPNLTHEDAMYVIYFMNVENWCGIGCDSAGNFWIRSGISNATATIHYLPYSFGTSLQRIQGGITRNVLDDTPVTWHTPVALNGWDLAIFGVQVRYTRNAAGLVTIEGLFNKFPLDNSVMFVLPDGFRPSQGKLFSISLHGGVHDGATIQGSVDVWGQVNTRALLEQNIQATWATLSVNFQI